jgi:apolipoprotein N-acyltransferase
VSGILLYVGFPPLDLSFFVWIALVPLFLSINQKGAKQGFLLAFVSSMVFFPGIFHWIFEVPGYSFVHHVILGLYLGSYFGLFGLVFGFVSRKWGVAPGLFAAPFIWVCQEYARANISFLALPWGLLAHSQYQYPQLIQIASVTGAYGVSFLIVMVNSALAALVLLLLYRLDKKKSALHHPAVRRETLAVVIVAGGCFALALLYGRTALSKRISGPEIKVAVVQGNIEQYKKWDRKYAKVIMQTYAGLTKEASEQQPALIIWPETATPWAINQNARLYARVRRIARSAETYLLLGSSQHRKFSEKESEQIKPRNAAFLIAPRFRSGSNQRYDKIRLLPFGEYLPLKETIPWSFIRVPEVGGYEPGKELTVFQHPSFRFSATICWENIFPELVRQIHNRGASLNGNSYP